MVTCNEIRTCWYLVGARLYSYRISTLRGMMISAESLPTKTPSIALLTLVGSRGVTGLYASRGMYVKNVLAMHNDQEKSQHHSSSSSSSGYLVLPILYLRYMIKYDTVETKQSYHDFVFGNRQHHQILFYTAWIVPGGKTEE